MSTPILLIEDNPMMDLRTLRGQLFPLFSVIGPCAYQEIAISIEPGHGYLDQVKQRRRIDPYPDQQNREYDQGKSR